MKKFSNPSGIRYFLYFILAASLFLTAFQAQTSGGISPLVVALIVILLILIVLIVWLYLRSRQAPTTGEIAAKITPTPAAPTKPDDLVIIEGIEPKIASILQSAGITTFKQLAATDETRLRQILEQGGVRLADPGTWAEQARLAAAGDMDGLKALQDRLNAGRAV